MSKNNMFNCSVKQYAETYQQILATMIQDMTQAQLTESISYNFIVQMIPHHEAAIAMSHNILQYTTNNSLKAIASHIITEQTQSIRNMQNVLTTCETIQNTVHDVDQYQCYISRILKTMFSAMKNAHSDKRINCDFMREMIPHHQGAVKMSKLTLSYNICSELRPILETIIISQEKGICQMRSLLQCMNCIM